MQGATTYEALKDAIADAYPDMSGQLQRIARFVLERPHDLALGDAGLPPPGRRRPLAMR